MPVLDADQALRHTFSRLSGALVSSLDLHDLLGTIVDEALASLHAEASVLRLLDRPGEHLEVEVARGVPEEAVRAVRFRAGEGLAGRLLLDDRPLRGTNMQQDPRATQRALAHRYGWRSFAAVTIRLHQQPIGVWFVIRHRRVPFTDDEILLLSTFADHVSLAIERSWLLQTIVQEKHESEAVVEASASGILVIDHRGRVVDMNPALEQLTGWTLRQARGQPCCDVIGCGAHGQAEPNPFCPLAQVSVPGDRAFVEYSLLRRDGKAIEVEASYGLIRDEDGELARVVGVFRDVSQQKELNRLRAEIIANVSHELRTPLSLIKGYVSTLLSPDVSLGEEQAQRFLHNLDRAADDLGQMVDDLLSASRIEAQQLHLHPESFDLLSKIHEILDWFRPLVPDHHLAVDLPPPGRVQVWADPQRVHQVLVNLLSNAVKYSPPGSTVTIRGQAIAGTHAVVHVIDEGEGIASEHLPHIFDRFYLTERSKKGIGLGLYICKGMVEAMGGEIWAVSERGQGSTFTFTLPTAPVASTAN
ncbi:MAG: GAF domain-containing protein [Anaerolineae bacterium]|nr:GAF domain-containing protein [Anaerolineae bacterium]